MLTLLVLQVLAQDDGKKAAEERIARFKQAYKAAKDDAAKTEEIKGLASYRHSLVAKELIKLLTAKESNEIRAFAAKMLAENFRNDRDVADAILGAINQQPTREMKIKMIEAEGGVGCRAIAPSLHNFFGEKDIDLARAAIEACGKIGGKVSIDPLIALLKSLDKIEVAKITTADNPRTLEDPKREILERKTKLSGACIGALRDITGEEHGTGAAWEKWWNANRAKFKEREDK